MYRLAEKEHEEMIQQEQTRMTARPYQFQYHGRVRPPQYAWYWIMYVIIICIIYTVLYCTATCTYNYNYI